MIKFVNTCDLCIFNETKNNKDICINCKDNPIVQKIISALPKTSFFQSYQPICPRGYSDCVHDPAYIKCFSPERYKELYGDMTPKEAIKSEDGCCHNYIFSIDNMYCNSYDTEDK